MCNFIIPSEDVVYCILCLLYLILRSYLKLRGKKLVRYSEPLHDEMKNFDQLEKRILYHINSVTSISYTRGTDIKRLVDL